jgi:hypothetical protein
MFVGSIRDFDRLIEERLAVQGPAFFSAAGGDGLSSGCGIGSMGVDTSSTSNITRGTSAGWQTDHGVSTDRAVLRPVFSKASALSRCGGCCRPRADFYQPLVLGVVGYRGDR